jgi:hypothetical protein
VEAGDSFADGFEKRGKSEMLKRWNGILDTLYDSGDKFDFGRLLDDTSLSSLDASLEKIRDTMAKFNAADKLDDDLFIKADDALKAQVEALREVLTLDEQHGQAIAENTRLEQLHTDAIRENNKLKKLEAEQARQAAEWRKVVADAEDAQHAEAIRINRQKNKEELDFQKAVAEAAAARHAEALRMNEEWNARRRKTFEEALAENEKWKRSFEGIRKMADISGLEQDFRKLSTAMDDASISKFMKGFESFDDMRSRVIAVTDAMKEQGRISEENAAAMHARVNQWITDRQEELRLEAEALDRARELREAQERYKTSLDGMVSAAHFQRIERDFKNLTDAIASGDWSKLARAGDDMESFRDRVRETADQLRAVGRVSDEEYTRIRGNIDNVSDGALRANTAVRESNGETRRWSISMGDVRDKAKSLAGHMSNTLGHFKGLAGLNVFGDILDDGIQIASNIDRVAQSIGQASLKIGSAASILLSAGGGLVNIISDLGSTLNIGWLAPGFLAAAGIQIGVLVAAFKDMKTKLKDLTPQFQALQDHISDAFWKQAEQPIRNLVKSLMPTLDTQLRNTATQLGGLFGALADGFTKNATPARVEGMFKKMNEAIGIAKGAMEPLTSALVTLGEHAAGYFKSFAEGIVGMSEDFNRFVTDAAKDGRLKRWTDEAIQAFKNTGRAVGGVVEIFQGLNQAAEKAGIGGLKEFADSLERAADIAKSPQFQEGLSLWLSGAKDATDSIVEAIDQRLFPALGNIAPVAETALQQIGETMGTIIGYVSDLIENPKVQEGILAVTTGLQAAVDILQPAIKPMGDSLGSLLDIIGHILTNTAEVVTAFTVTLGPTIDDIGRKFESMADPLTGVVKDAIRDLGPVLQAVNEKFVGPLVSAINTKLLPAIDSFVHNAAPFLQKVAETVGPVFATLVGDTLPAVLRFAEGLFKPLGALFDLMTPALRDIVAGIGDSFNHFSGALEAFNKWADPAYKLMAAINVEMGKLNGFKLSDTSNPIADLIAKYTISAIAADPAVASFAAFFGKLSKGWTSSLSEFIKVVSDPKTYVISMATTMAANLPSWMFEGFSIAEFSVAVGTWLHTNIYTPLKDAWKTFLVSLALIFVGGGGDGGDGSDPSGGTPMGGMAVGAKVMPMMLDPEGEKTFLDTFITGITTKIGGWGALINASMATWQAGTKLAWDGFWNGLPASVEGGMGPSSAKVATSTVAMGINIGAFIAQNAPKWAGFFSTAQQQTNTNMASAATTVAGKTLAMSGSIGTFTTNAKTTWTTALAAMAATATQQWNSMSGTTTTKASVIATTVATKMGAVKTDTDTSLAKMAALFVQHFLTAKTEVDGSLGTIVGKFAGLAGRITTALSGLRGTLESIGGDAMDGFKAGIDAKAGLIASAAAAVVAGAITAAREAQKSNSPSKIYRGLGNDAGDGYALGFGDSESPVARAAAAMADMAISAVGTSRMYAAGVDAAKGLADGLKSQGSLMESTLSAMVPDLQATITASGSGFGTTPVDGSLAPAGKTVIFQEGAVRVDSKASNPGVVASMVIDDIADIFDSSDA